MALITCPECGKEISDSAMACPNCGKPMNQYYAEEPKKKKKGLGCLMGIGVLCFLLGILAVTCPDKKDHRERISSEISAVVMSEVNEESNVFAGIIASAVAGPLVNHVLDEMLVVDSYGIVSIGRLKNIDDGKDRIVSIGAANYVFSGLNEEKIKKYVEDQLK